MKEKSETHDNALKGIKVFYTVKINEVRKQLQAIQNSAELDDLGKNIELVGKSIRCSAECLKLAIEKMVGKETHETHN